MTSHWCLSRQYLGECVALTARIELDGRAWSAGSQTTEIHKASCVLEAQKVFDSQSVTNFLGSHSMVELASALT